MRPPKKGQNGVCRSLSTKCGHVMRIHLKVMYIMDFEVAV